MPTEPGLRYEPSAMALLTLSTTWVPAEMTYVGARCSSERLGSVMDVAYRRWPPTRSQARLETTSCQSSPSSQRRRSLGARRRVRRQPEEHLRLERRPDSCGDTGPGQP